MEDQQASTVKGEEELSSDITDEAAEVQDTELEASPEPVEAEEPEVDGESSGSDSSVEEEADIEPAAEEEEQVAEVEESAAEKEEPEAEEEEPEAEAEESEAEIEEPEAEIEEPEAEAEEPEAEEEDPEAEAEEPEAEVEEPEAEEEEPAAEAETEDKKDGEEPTEAEEAVETVEKPEIEDEALADVSSVEAPDNGNDGQFAAMPDELAAEPVAEVPVQRVAEPDDGREWYVVHCYSGYENKVRHNLEQRIETMDMKGKIFDVVVPTEEEMEVKEGKRRTIERRVFPGYILVQMIMDEDSWYVVRNTPGVTGFVGMGNEPTPLRPEEVSQIVKRMEADAPRIKVTYDVGQKVRIIDGPFNDFIGTVDDIDMDKAKVRVMVSFFGRETPVELDFLQVEKA